MGVVFCLRHSVKLPTYIPQFFSFGEIALINAGQVMITIGKLRANVGSKKASATLNGNTPRYESCQRM